MVTRSRAVPQLAALVAALLVTAQTSAQEEPLTPEYLIGIWSFDGTCASGAGMSLQPDGEVWYDEWGTGLWLYRDGTIRMILQEVEMGVDVVTGVLPLTIEIESTNSDGFTGRYVEDGQPVTATRCD